MTSTTQAKEAQAMSEQTTRPKHDAKPEHKPDAKPETPATPDAKADANGAGRPEGSKTKRPDTSGFDLDAIASASIATPELIIAAAPRIERKPEQLAMDKVAERAHAAWVKAGRPAAWGKLPVITYYLSPTQVEGFKYLIRRACDFHGTRPRFGSPVRLTEAMALKAGRPATDVGKEVLAWAVVDRKNRASDEKPADAKPDEAKPKADAK